MGYLITYRLFMNNHAATSVTITEVLGEDPVEWWQGKKWQGKANTDDWDGCTILMIHRQREMECKVRL